MVDTTATRAGRKFQRDITRYLREQGFKADNLALSGSQDEGDLWVQVGSTLVDSPDDPNTLDLRDKLVVVEAKREKGFRPAEWIKQAKVERDNFAKHRGLTGVDVPGFVVVAARRNHGIGKAYAITELDEWLRQVES